MREYRHEFPLAVMCRVLEVSRSGYYAWLGREESRRARANRGLLVKIRAAHKRSRKTYGSPRVCRELRAAGESCGKNRVARLMRAHGIVGVRRPKFRTTTDSRHLLPVAPNLLQRRFGVSEANRVWVSDLTCVWTGEGWLYVAGVLDLFLAEHQMVASMSRKGDCWDNAPAESFFATLKSELVHRRRYRTRAEAKRDLFEYIERFYNTERRHSALEYRSPAEFEARANTNIIHQCVH
jgi:putative transposase